MAEVFEAGDVVLQSGMTLSGAKLVFETHGELAPDRSNVVLCPTRFGGTHTDNGYLIGEGRPLDPRRWFIVVPNLLGNGLSSSPSNTPPPLDGPGFPHVTILDNVLLQQRLLRERLGVEEIALAVGWSMGAQQVLQWASYFPDQVRAVATICGTATCSPHNHVFLEGVKEALTTDAAFEGGRYVSPPRAGIRAIARVWAGWELSQDWFRAGRWTELGFASVEDFLLHAETTYLKRDANDMLCHIRTWQHANIGANDTFGGDGEAALTAISARAILMPCETDLYFRVADSEEEASRMRNAEVRILRSDWGHVAGGGTDPVALKVIDGALRDLLDDGRIG